MPDAFEEVLATVRERVEPSRDERERLDQVVEQLLEGAELAVAGLAHEASVRHVGSTARDTWLSGERDVDIFVMFSPDLTRNELEAAGLEVGHAVLQNGREEYAEHPYVTGSFDGFDVDIVPCYAVDSAREIQSSVDRTPFHADYLADRLTPKFVNEVRAFKQLLASIGVYGSDLKTEGFSGFLTELLVLEFAGVRPLIEAVADWNPPVVLDPAGHGEASFDDPLVVIDPTDPRRNVAAVLAASNLARLQHYARVLLEEPQVEVFFRQPPAPLTASDVREHVETRGTLPIAIVFEAPDLVEDELYPQLRKSLDGIGEELDRRGFDVFRRTTFADDEAVLLFELGAAERPAVERHEGPPVWMRDHAESFFAVYDERDDYGPFIDGDRYVVERPREFSRAVDLLESEAVLETRLGPGIEAALRNGYELVVGVDLATLAPPFGEELAAYFEPSP